MHCIAAPVQQEASVIELVRPHSFVKLPVTPNEKPTHVKVWRGVVPQRAIYREGSFERNQIAHPTPNKTLAWLLAYLCACGTERSENGLGGRCGGVSRGTWPDLVCS